ncbi:MAG: phage tail tape measure protein [Deltaproteobacteria bacterium]|nr:phage tail tape measure protein [Deltaproteobacteria bacterium]
MGLRNMGLGMLLKFRSIGESGITRVQGKFKALDDTVTGGAERMTSAFKQIGIGMAMFTVGAAAFGTGLALAGAAGKFEQGLASVGAVTRATTQELALLKDTAIQAGIDTQFSPTEAIEGLQSLATAGQTATQATRTLTPVLDLAADSLGQLGVAQAAEAVVGTLNAYGMAAEQSAGVTDKLLRVTQLTNFQTRDFEIGLSKAAAAGATFNQDLDDVLVTMGLLRNRNIDASSSATAFREATRRVGAESRAQQAITGAGVKIFDKQSGKMRSIVDIMSDFATATEHMTDAERNRRVKTAFGARGLLAFNAIQKAAFTTMKDGVELSFKGAEAISRLRMEMGAASPRKLDDVSAAMELLSGKSVNASHAAAGFSSATRRLSTDTKAQKALMHMGVTVFDKQTGKMRSVVQLMDDLHKATKNTSAAERIRFARIAFGVRGLTAFNSLQEATWTTVRDGKKVVLQGAEAIAAMRREMSKTKGTAQEFREKLLDTFQGQKTLLTGTLQTWAVSLGEPFAAVFKPIVSTVVSVLNFLLKVFQVIPTPIKEAFSSLMTFAGAFVAIVGAVVAAKGAFILLKIAMNAVGVTAGGLLKKMVPFLIVIAAISAASAALRWAYQKNIGGFGDFIDRTWARIKNLWNGISKIFSQGGFSGAVREELNRAENQGIKTFVIDLYMFVHRVKKAWKSFKEGFVDGFASVKEFVVPAITALGESIMSVSSVWEDFGGSTASATGALNDSAAAWETTGGSIAVFLGSIVTAVAWFGWFVTTAVKGVLFFGRMVGEGAAIIVLWLTEDVPNAISSAWASVKKFFSPVATFFERVKEGIRKALEGIISFAFSILRRMPDALLPESLVKLKANADFIERRVVTTIHGDSSPLSTQSTSSAMPSAVESQGRAREMDDIKRTVSELARAKSESIEDRPLNLNLQVDGETIARASHKADLNEAGRAFSQVPVY